MKHRFTVRPEYCVEYHAHKSECGPDRCYYTYGDVVKMCTLPYADSIHITAVDDLVDDIVKKLEGGVELNNDQAKTLLTHVMMRWRKS